MARVQVTVDPELARAIAEFGSGDPRSQTIRDLAVRGAQALRQDREHLEEAIGGLDRIAAGEDDDFDFEVSEALRLERR